MKEFNELKEIMAAAQDDCDKATAGNQAAGTRLRKAMQAVRNKAQDVRKAVLASQAVA